MGVGSRSSLGFCRGGWSPWTESEEEEETVTVKGGGSGVVPHPRRLQVRFGSD